jgi:PAS domain S-box-containing protein
MFGFSTSYHRANFVGLLVVFAFLLLIALFFTSGFSQSIFNPPYLAYILQLFFVFGIGLAVVFVSAKSYIQTGAPNILILGNAILISSLSFTISATALTPQIPPTFTANQAVIIGNIGVLISSLVLLVSAIVTRLGTEYNPRSSKKTMLAVSFLISIATITVVSVFSALNLFPVFLTSSGPTLLRLVVLALTTIFYFASSVLFGWQYVRSKSQVVYWFSLALALFGAAYLAGVLTIHVGSAMTWVSRLGLYLSGIFLLLALLSPEGKRQKQPYAAKWSEAFRSDQRQMEAFISKIAEGFAYCKIITDAEGKPVDWLYLDVNDSYERINDADRNKVVGRKATEVDPGIREDPADWINVYGHVALTGEPIVLESFSKDRNKWYHVSAYSPQKGYFVSLLEDITERKKSEQTLKESEEKYRELFTSITEMFQVLEVIYDEYGKAVDFYYRDVNPATERLSGMSKEEMVGRRAKELFGEVEDYWIESLSQVNKTGKSVHLDNYSAALDKFYDVTMFKVERGQNRVAIIFSDITERKKAEDALRQSEELSRQRAEELSKLMDIIPAAVWVSRDPLCENIIGNQAANKFYEAGEAENVSAGPTTGEAQDTARRFFRDGRELKPQELPMQEAAAKSVEIRNSELDVILPSDRKITILGNAKPLLNDAGKVRGCLAVFMDITERKKALEATAKQAELIDLSPDAIIIRKVDGTITFWSKGAEKLYGWTKDEAIGQDINSLLKTELPQSLEAIQNTLKIEGKWSGEIVHVCKDGSKLVVQSYWLGKFGSDGKIVEVLESNVDITERIQMQLKLEESAVRLEEYATQMEELANQRAAQLKDAERLAAIGATAGMVGHDIRNPLQAITGDVYLAKTELATIPEGEEKKNIQESLAEIEKNVDYINKIVADLQDFARPLKPNDEETDLKLVINDLLSKNGLPENIKVSVKVETEKIVADSTFINRILYNLVNNAVQAMPKGGKLTIRTYKEANDTVISVKDTGVGIPEAVKGKLFTPMFTTKAKGQGFGLAVIKRMAEALGGNVSFESQEGKGTTFIVRLPPTQGAER